MPVAVVTAIGAIVIGVILHKAAQARKGAEGRPLTSTLEVEEYGDDEEK